MSGKEQTAGSEFDAWMTGKPSADEGAAADEAQGEESPQAKGKKSATSGGLATVARKPMVLIPVVLAVAVTGLALVRGGGEPSGASETEYAAITAMPSDVATVDLTQAEPTADAGIYEQFAEPAGEVQAVDDPDAVATVDAADPEDAVPVVEAEAMEEPRPEPEPEVDAADQPTQKELELRIAALENDLERARQTREANLRSIRGLRAQLKELEGAGTYSVVAVLNDGVVVRDNSGSERVYGLGARIGE